MTETNPTPAVTDVRVSPPLEGYPHGIFHLLEHAEHAVAEDCPVESNSLGAAIHVVHEGKVLVQTYLGECQDEVFSVPISLDFLRQAAADYRTTQSAAESKES